MSSKEGKEFQKPADPSESESRRDRGRSRYTSVFSPRLECEGDPSWPLDPRGPITAATAPLKRAHVLEGGLRRTSTSLPTPFWPPQVSCRPCLKVFCTWMLWPLQLDITARVLFSRKPDASLMFLHAVERKPIRELADSF